VKIFLITRSSVVAKRLKNKTITNKKKFKTNSIIEQVVKVGCAQNIFLGCMVLDLQNKELKSLFKIFIHCICE
jgi:hypothetical protein